MGRFEKYIGLFVVRHRWWILVATMVLVVAALAGVRFLTFNNDTRVFFSQDNPQLQALEALENTYNRSDDVLFVLAPRDDQSFSLRDDDLVQIELAYHF